MWWNYKCSLPLGWILIKEKKVKSLSHVWLFCNPMDCSPPGSSVHLISQARILEWATISFSRESSQPRDWTYVSCIGRQVLYWWATREALIVLIGDPRTLASGLPGLSRSHRASVIHAVPSHACFFHIYYRLRDQMSQFAQDRSGWCLLTQGNC